MWVLVDADLEVGTANVPVNVPVSKTSQTLLQLISDNMSVTYDELAEATGLTRKTVQRNIQTLKNSGLIK